MEDDPFSGSGNLWSFNYFFFNRQLKRIMYFTCIAASKFMPGSPLSAGAASYDLDGARTDDEGDRTEEEPEPFMGDFEDGS